MKQKTGKWNSNRVYNVLKDDCMQDKRGFTLFELLIALFVGTVLVMSGVYAIRIGLFSMEREGAWFSDSTREKAAFDFFWQQASSLYNQKLPKENRLLSDTAKKKKDKMFVGEDDFLVFVSPLSLKKHYTQGLIIANYKVKINDNGKLDLIYVEKRLNPKLLMDLAEGFKTNFRMEANAVLYEDYTVFFNDCELIAFEYLVSGKESMNDNEDIEDIEGEDESPPPADKYSANIKEDTKAIWKGKIIGKIPKAIKLTVTKNGEEQVFITPIMVMYSFLAYGR
ncbi:MAG: prepilin-type N-terminal cleavage/methylation domain-containing protein [Planctomycetes bacterium]|nr:prepilin-type N-terminal cleavage/methylation domain-containing protein [Planctomycetota bacterium]